MGQDLFRQIARLTVAEDDAEHGGAKMLIHVRQSEADHARALPLRRVTGNGRRGRAGSRNSRHLLGLCFSAVDVFTHVESFALAVSDARDIFVQASRIPANCDDSAASTPTFHSSSTWLKYFLSNFGEIFLHSHRQKVVV